MQYTCFKSDIFLEKYFFWEGDYFSVKPKY